MEERYARQTMLPEIGERGQRRLSEASVLIVGIGGLGSAAALYHSFSRFNLIIVVTKWKLFSDIYILAFTFDGYRDNLLQSCHHLSDCFSVAQRNTECLVSYSFRFQPNIHIILSG